MKRTDEGILMSEKEYRSIVRKLKRANRQRLCTSKKILVLVWSITLFLIGMSIYAFLFTDKEVTEIVTLTGVVTAASAADTAFYSWKAKAENKIKLTQSMINSIAKEHGIDAVVSLAGIVLSD